MSASLAAEVAQMRASALDLLEEYEMHAPPINVYQILKKKQVEVDFWPFPSGNIEGLYRYDVTGPGIAINNQHHPVKQRFTAGHELKHHLHDIVDGSATHTCLSSRKRRKIERQANSFSAELLVPPHMLQSAIQELGSELLTITTLAGAFRVSYPCIVYRLNTLGYIGDTAKRKYVEKDYRYQDIQKALANRNSAEAAQLQSAALLDALGHLNTENRCPGCSATLFNSDWEICPNCNLHLSQP